MAIDTNSPFTRQVAQRMRSAAEIDNDGASIEPATQPLTHQPLGQSGGSRGVVGSEKRVARARLLEALSRSFPWHSPKPTDLPPVLSSGGFSRWRRRDDGAT